MPLVRQRSSIERAPEFKFVLACLDWPLVDLARIRTLAAQVVDWAMVLAIAERHRVLGLVDRARYAAGLQLPAEAVTTLTARSKTLAVQGLLATWECGNIQAALQPAGVTPIFLKGPALSMLVYGEAGLRHAKDIDILVPQESLQPVNAALHSAGYQKRFPAQTVSAERDRELPEDKSAEWVHPARNIEVEVHRQLTDMPLLRSAVTLHNTQDVQLSPVSRVRTLDIDTLLLYLCVHGASHAWSRLKWLADVDRLIRRKSLDELELFYQNARDVGAGRAVGQALLLCSEFLSLPLPAHLHRQLRRDLRLRCATAMARRTILRGAAQTEIYDTPFGTTLVYLSRLLLGDNFSFFADELRRILELPQRELVPARVFFYPRGVRIAARITIWLIRRARYLGRSGPRPV